MKPIKAVTPMTTPTPIVSKMVKTNILTFDGSKFEKHVVLRNTMDGLKGIDIDLYYNGSFAQNF